MGAWGAGIFADDLAADVRSAYRELLEDQVSDSEAMARVIAAHETDDPDEAHVLWLALAAAQSQVGRLDVAVRDRALAIIASGTGLHLWEEAGPQELVKRQSALDKLRTQLVDVQPPRRTLRRPWHDVTDLRAGEVLARALPSGTMALFRVPRIDAHRVGVAPVLERLEWSGPGVPEVAVLRRLPVRIDYAVSRFGFPDTHRVARLRKKDPTWRDCGFAVVARLPRRAADVAVEARCYCSWTSHAEELDEDAAID